MGRIVGEPIRSGEASEFFSGAVATPVFARGADGGTIVTNPVVAGIGESMISRSDAVRRQGPERVMAGAPKFWTVINRAEQGFVKVWMGVFNGEAYPEYAVGDDKATWLQPGEEMILPLDAALHFFGNVFDPRAPEAMEIIERCGGFQLETQKTNPGKNPELRVIGGPVGLPDFIVTPMDGRKKSVGKGIELYPHYWGAVRKKVLKVRKDRDPEVMETERLLLQERVREYTMEEDPDEGAIYGPDGRVVSTTQSRDASAPSEEIPDMRTSFTDGVPEEEDSKPARRGK